MRTGPDGKPLRILIVNDDGIDAPGIKLLEKAALQFTDDVWVVAPDEERSGAGHAISISHPVRYIQRDERHFAVKGSPTDCALLGIYEFLADRPPNMLLSGINRGPNLGEDITYSGTTSAAMEGAVLGIPCAALSLVWKYQTEVQWPTAEKYAPEVIDLLLKMHWKRGTFVNVNFPHVPVDQVTGLQVTTQGMRPPGSFKPIRRIDERHVPYFWVKIDFQDGEEPDGTDLKAVRDGAVSITPCRLDMTDEALHRELSDMLV